MTAPHWVVELVVYDPSNSGTRTLRYANIGFATTPTDSPANTHYDERILQPAVLRRELFSGGATQGARSRVGYGDLVLANGDGALDALVGYGFDGRTITIRRGTVGDAYPSAYATLLVGTMAGVEVNLRTVTVKLRDRQAEVEVPLQTTKYAGDNALPAGLEGVATDLKGKPKPICYGVVKNVPAPCVNTSKLIYQVNDGAVASVDMVYDRGVRLQIGLAWTSQTHQMGTDGIQGAAYGAGVFVIVGLNGKLSSSPDGETWTARTSQFGATHIRAVAYGNGVFVAVGDAGKMSTSTDGQTWTAESALTATTLRFVFYGDGLWVTGGNNATDKLVWTAADPTGAWTGATIPSAGGGGSVDSGAYGAGLYVCAGTSGYLITSPDGTTWTKQSAGQTSGTVSAMAYGEQQGFVGVGNGILVTSPTGLNWTLRQTGYPINYGAVFNLDGLWLVGGNETGTSDAVLLSSLDAAVWVKQANPLPNGDTPRGIAFDGTTLIVGGGSASTSNLSTAAAAAQTYASLTDLEDDDLAPAPGTYKVYLAGGYFRLGAVPDGSITADVTQGAAASNRTAAQLWKAVLERTGFTSADYSAADITALDAANAAVLGYWTDQEIRASDVLDLIAQSVGAWWGIDRTGVFRIQQLTAPSGTPVLALTANDLLQVLTRVTPQDPGRGIPVYRTIVRWGRLGVVQTTDLAGAVMSDRRAFLAKEWREAQATDATVQTAHPLAPELIVDTLLTTESDAQTEATRLQALRGVARDRYELVIPLDEEAVVADLGNVISLTHARFGLSAGKSFRVVVLGPDAAREQLRAEIWG